MPRPNGDAEYLLRHPLLTAIFARMEADAIEMAVSAKLGDDDTRRGAMERVRAIRSIRADLRLFADGKATAPDDAGA